MSLGTKPWVEKYRPKTISDVESQDEVIKILSKTIETGNLPHLLFYGIPGTGKTSSILALARDLFGSTYKDKVLELNASDERGIQVIREKVKNFASTATNKNDKCPFKLIILDEADSMTHDAQSALRRTMERYTKVTRFCLICNYISRIIEPLGSRCVKFRFKPLPNEGIMHRLQTIAEQEDVDVTDKTLDVLIKISQGDLRRAITLLQSASSLNDGQVTTDIVLDISGSLNPKTIEKIWTTILSKNFNSITNMVREIISRGLEAPLVIAEIQKTVVESNDIDDLQKSHMLLEIACVDKNLEESADEELQLLALFSKLQTI